MEMNFTPAVPPPFVHPMTSLPATPTHSVRKYGFFSEPTRRRQVAKYMKIRQLKRRGHFLVTDMECRLYQNSAFHKDMILDGYLEKRMWTFAECLGHYFAKLMSWTFAKLPGHLLRWPGHAKVIQRLGHLVNPHVSRLSLCTHSGYQDPGHKQHRVT